nr:MAG TPA: hypothetical protein [Caudoviricetes sp.]
MCSYMYIYFQKGSLCSPPHSNLVICISNIGSLGILQR